MLQILIFSLKILINYIFSLNIIQLSIKLFNFFFWFKVGLRKSHGLRIIPDLSFLSILLWRDWELL
jgi:hypothetical protein